MSPLHRSLLLSAVCALALGCSGNMVAQDASSGTESQSSGSDRASATASAPAEELPDSPGATWAKLQNAPQQSPPPQSANSQADSRTEDKDSPTDKKPDEKLQRPVGTAAAEGPRVSGVTAAQPAGAAIAPAKQRRVRTLVLKVGAIIGAGAAIGTVVALSAATPSKPPGAH
jgi:hypothetical protein